MATKKPTVTPENQDDHVIDAEVFRPPSDEEIRIAVDSRSFLELSHVPAKTKPKAISEQADLNDPDIAYPITIPTSCDWTMH